MYSSLYESTISLIKHIGGRRRSQFALLIFLSFFGSIFEMLSLGSIIPFIGIIVTPEKIFNLELASPLKNFFGYTSPSELILPFAIIFASLAVVAGSFRLLILYLNLHITFQTGAEMSQSVFKKTLRQPYEVHLSRNSSNLISVISNKVNIATNILSDRLKKLMKYNLIEYQLNPKNKKIKQYYLTEAGISLYPLIYDLLIWGRNNLDMNIGLVASDFYKRNKNKKREDIIKNSINSYKEFKNSFLVN